MLLRQLSHDDGSYFPRRSAVYISLPLWNLGMGYRGGCLNGYSMHVRCHNLGPFLGTECPTLSQLGLASKRWSGRCQKGGGLISLFVWVSNMGVLVSFGALRKGSPFQGSRSLREIKLQNASCQMGGREVTRR